MIQIPMQKGPNRSCIVITNEKINGQHRERPWKSAHPEKRNKEEKNIKERDGREHKIRAVEKGKRDATLELP